MKTLLFRRPLALVIAALILAGVVPAQAVRFTKGLGYRMAVFQTSSATRIAVGTNNSASLLILSIGDQVSIAYDQENGALVARHISDGVPPKPRNLHATPLFRPHHIATASTYAHIRGIVQSVDTQANTLTIAYRLK
jgi:hypothetical protein